MRTFCPPSPRILCICLAFLWGGSPSISQAAQDNPYDALGQVLQPLAAAFSPQSASRGVALELVLESATGLPAAFAGKRVELLVQPPDRFVVRAVMEGESWAMGRSGQEVWISPGSKVTALAPLPEPRKKKKKKERGLDAMELPFSPAQLSFLPILFTVKEGPPSEEARVLMVRLMPEIARSLGVEDWSARLFLSRESGRLIALELARPDWLLRVKVARLDISPSLPPESWGPLAGERADVVRVSGVEARRWLESLTERWVPAQSR